MLFLMSPNHNLYCVDCHTRFRSSQPEGHNRRCSNRQFVSFGRCLRCLHEHASPGVASQCQDFIDAVGGLTDSTHNTFIDLPSTLFAAADNSAPLHLQRMLVLRTPLMIRLVPRSTMVTIPALPLLQQTLLFPKFLRSTASRRENSMKLT